MYKFKVLTGKDVGKLEGVMNSGWELFQITTNEKQIVFILRMQNDQTRRKV